MKIPFVPIVETEWAPDKKLLCSEDYAVTVNGEPCQVRICRESAMPFNRVWPGYQRAINQTEMAYFVCFSADTEVRVRVEAKCPSATAVIRPLSRKVAVEAKENCFEFTLTKPGQYVLEVGSSHHSLYLFFDPPVENAGAESAKWHFGPGIHFPGMIRVESGDSVYIDPEAIVFGFIYGKGVHDVRIFGGGTLHGGLMGRVFGGFVQDNSYSTIKFYHSTNIRIQDIIVQDSPCWTVSFWGCSDIEMGRIKVLGQWRYNTDGIDLCNVSRAKILDSFVRSFDDTIVLKGVDNYKHATKWETGRPVADIEVRRCVLWCGWGRNIEVGIESGAPEFSNLLFDDCDLIHNSADCIAIQNGDHADIHDVTFRDIRVEYQTETMPEIYQRTEEQVYDGYGKPWLPTLIVAWNPRYGFHPCPKYGSIRNVLYENISALVEAGIPEEQLRVKIVNLSEDALVRDFTIRNLTVNGRKISRPEELLYETNGHVENVRWE